MQSVRAWVGIGLLGRSQFVACDGGPSEGFVMAAGSGQQ